MLLLIVLGSALLHPIDSLKIVPPSTIIEPQIPADNSIEYPSKNDEQANAIEGRFIVAEGNSDDFIKEDAVELGEGDTEDTKNDDKVRHRYDTINPSLPRIQIIEGRFIYNENDSDEHLFDKKDFEKHDAL